jgi:hypothetical protein
MAFYFQKTYRPEIEQFLRQYYQSLSEKDRRRFTALEAIQLGHGGTRYITKVGVFCPSPQRGIFQRLDHWHELRSDRDRVTPEPTQVLEISDLYSAKTRTLQPAIT